MLTAALREDCPVEDAVVTDWLDWPGLADIAPISIDELVPAGARAVVVAPHPDDEVLALGGLLAQLAAQAREICIVAVTDGIASSSETRHWPPDPRARMLPVESRRALHRLGVVDDPVRLGFPDGSLNILRRMLAERLQPLLGPNDVVFTTWRMDGPPDHEAAGHACAFAAARCGARLVETPVRAWHWAAPGDARLPWRRARRLPLDASALDRKRKALEAFEARLQTVPSIIGDPNLCNSAVTRAAWPFEVMFT
ncbi:MULTISPECIES: PIG-L deacetylase family protein [unclassified Variovorax]|uniref:PIG-L deacetylase family protein n=1 Tax=unclassified Variovorax TaxID=663243 RepID=UPI001BD2BA08|nr:MULTISPECIES: PIG-L family deacetylase [unclassified Variovorax]